MTCPLESMKWYKRRRRSMNLAHAIEEQSAFGYAFDRFSCNCENDMSFWSSSSDIIPKHLALNISFASLLKSLPLFPRKPIIRGNMVHSGQKLVFDDISNFFSLDFTKDSLWNLPTLDIYFCLLRKPKVWFLNILPLMRFEPEKFFPVV